MQYGVIVPRKAFTSLFNRHGEYIIGLAEENQPDYWPQTHCGTFKTREEAQAWADRLNKLLGISPKLAMLIVTSSMFPCTPEEHAERSKDWEEM